MSDPELTNFFRYRRDPIAFMIDVLGIDPALVWVSMREMAESVRDNRYTAIAGCHSSSKTYTAAALAWWWVLCWQPAKVYITGPRKESVEKVFFAQIREHYQNAPQPLGGELLLSEWKFTEDTFMIGSTSRKDTGATGSTGMQGYKSLRLMAIFEEATGIERHFFESAYGILTFPENRWICLGNPTNPNCGFRDLWNDPEWNCINIDALRNPNMAGARLDWENRTVDGGELIHPYLLDRDYIQGRMKWGEGSPAWESRIRGRFPTSAIDTLISLDDFEKATSREPTRSLVDDTYIGVDVAAEGDDWTVIVVVRNDELVHVEAFHEPDVTRSGDRVIKVAMIWGLTHGRASQVTVDKGGLGVGCYNHIRRQGWNVQGEDFGRKAHRPELYYLRRTEMWVGVRDWLRDVGSLKNTRQDWLLTLEADLCGCTVNHFKQVAEHTILELERKQDMKKRLGHSPDHGDALALALSHRTRYRAISMTPRTKQVIGIKEDDVRFRSYQEDEKNKRARKRPQKRAFYD